MRYNIFTMQKKVDQVIKSLKKYNPSKVILFGSAAKGDATADSDVDVLVVKDTNESFWDRQKSVASLIDTDFAVDAFVLTPLELDTALKESQPFIYDAVNEGEIIYEQA
jgi:uncharacterized protein